MYVGHTRDPNRPRDETFQMDEAAAELASAVLDMGGWLWSVLTALMPVTINLNLLSVKHNFKACACTYFL